ncbi:MAG: hypothetical protein HYZ53_14455 [Planctomycetes bacterium]|nr:hypothetical protein [Planctomycetota bacterium]
MTRVTHTLAALLLGGAPSLLLALPSGAEERLLLRQDARVGDRLVERSVCEVRGKRTLRERGAAREFPLLSRDEEETVDEVLEVAEGLPVRVRRRYPMQRTSTTRIGTEETDSRDGPLSGLTFLLEGLGTRRKATCEGKEPSELDEAVLRRVEHAPIGLLLPATPVAVGEVWEVPAAAVNDLYFSSGLEHPEHARLGCRLAEVVELGGRRCARIALELDLASIGESGSRTRMESRGFLLFALEQGAPVRLEMAGHVVATGTWGEGEESVEVEAGGDLTLTVDWSREEPIAGPGGSGAGSATSPPATATDPGAGGK